MSHTSLSTINHQRKREPGQVADLGPLFISGMAEVRNLKFGIWLQYVRYNLADNKLPPNNARPESENNFSN